MHDMSRRTILLAGRILAAAMARLVPHPPSVTPIGAMALFGGLAMLENRVSWMRPGAATMPA